MSYGVWEYFEVFEFCWVDVLKFEDKRDRTGSRKNSKITNSTNRTEKCTEKCWIGRVKLKIEIEDNLKDSSSSPRLVRRELKFEDEENWSRKSEKFPNYESEFKYRSIV